MNREWTWKVLGVVGLIVLSTLMLVPTFAGSGEGEESAAPEWFTNIFSKKLILGLDLQGGIHLQYRVDIEEALGRRAAQLSGQMELLLAEEKVDSCKAIPKKDAADLDEATMIIVTCAEAADVDKIDTTFLQRNFPDYEVSSTDSGEMVLVMSDAAIDLFRTESLDKAIETIERRINEFGVAESTISRRGDTEIVVQLPGVKESEFGVAKEKLAQTGQLHFKIVDRAGVAAWLQTLSSRIPKPESWPADLDEELKQHAVVNSGGSLRSTSRQLLEYIVADQTDAEHLVGYEEIFVDPSDSNLSPINNLSKEQERNLRRRRVENIEASVVKGYQIQYLKSREGMSGENVVSASIGFDRFNKPLVLMQFGQQDADEFYEMTKKHTQELMAILIDEIVYSAPVIREPIPGGRVQIELGSAMRSPIVSL